MKKFTCLLIIAFLMLSMVGCSDSNNDKKELIGKLQGITDVEYSDEKYCFINNSSNVEWKIVYTEENEFANLQEPLIQQSFEEIFGDACLVTESASEGGFCYDLDENEARIYFDVDVEEGHLSSISYNFDKESVTLSINGDKYVATDEFIEILNAYNLPNIMVKDVEAFKVDLQNAGIEYQQILKLKYGDIYNVIGEKVAIKSDDIQTDGLVENETTIAQDDLQMPLAQLDMADYVGGDIQTLLAKCSDIVEDEDGMMYSDVTGNIIITAMDSIIDTVIIEESADAPSFAGISIGDNIYELEGADLESYGYAYAAESEGIIGFGHSDGSAGVMFAVDAEGYVLSISWMDNLLEMMDISAGMEEDVLRASAQDTNDLTGTYVDEELGEKIVIIQEDNLVTYKYCGLDDTSPIIETECTVESDYINGQYYYISKNMDGTLALSSGVGGSWGNFVKVDNEAIIELEETGDIGL